MEYISTTFVVSRSNRLFGLCSLLVALCGANEAAAAEGSNDCWAVYQAGVDQALAGHLHDASSIFQNCALDSCKSPVRQLCESKLFRLELDAPSVVPLLDDAGGSPLIDATLTMDGALLATRLDGRAIAVDPGVHVFVFERGGEVISTQTLVIAQGQRNRELRASVPKPAPEPPPEPEIAAAPLPARAPVTLMPHEAPENGPSAAPYLLGGAALLGAGAYALLSTWGRGDNAKLSQCKPNCSAGAVSHIRALYIAADVSLGIAAAAAIASVTTFILSGSGSHRESNSHASYALSIQPERSGALATFRGTL